MVVPDPPALHNPLRQVAGRTPVPAQHGEIRPVLPRRSTGWPAAAADLLAAWTGLLAAVVCLFATPALSAEPDSQQLVRQLGSSRFEERIAAEAALRERGAESLAAIEQAVHSTDPEVRIRAERLLEYVRREALQQQMTNFMERKPVPEGFPPSWDRFEDYLGDGPDSRALYAELLLAEPELFYALARSPKEFAEAFEARCQEFLQVPRQYTGSASMATTTALLFFAGLPEFEPTRGAQQGLYSMAAVLANTVQQGTDKSTLIDERRAILGFWVSRAGTESVSQRLGIAIRTSMREGLIPAREVIRAGRASGHSDLATALMFAAAQCPEEQTRELIAEIELLLEDDRVISRREDRAAGKEPQILSSEVRDLALAALLKLTNQNTDDYGLKKLRPGGALLYQFNTVCFPVQGDERRQALSKWANWRSVGLKPVLAPPVQAIEGIAL